MKKNVLLLLVSLAIGLLVAEAICRWQGGFLSYNERNGSGAYTSPFDAGNAGWIWAYHPGQKRFVKREEFIDSFTANADGLKERNVSIEKKGKRILILGDSFTEGVGAPADSSYPRILESVLKQSGDTSVEVIDAGISGSDIFFEYKLAQALIQKYNPDVVIETTNPSDISDCLTRGGFERFLPENKLRYRNGPWFEPLYAHSYLVRAIVRNVLHYDFNFIPRKNYDAAVKNAQAQICTAIDSFQCLCQNRGVKLAIVFQPFLGDIETPQRYNMKSLANYCQQKNIPFIDDLAYLQSSGISVKNAETIYWPLDGHFKSAGYRLVALSVYQLLQQQNLLAPENILH